MRIADFLRRRARGATDQSEPTTEDIRLELDRIVASDSFSAANRSREFFRYAVEETLAGRAERVKGFTIAVDVFGRDDDFDSNTDPLVRGEARRLRQRLSEYYATEGRSNPIRISMPSGSYVPRFAKAATRQHTSLPVRSALGVGALVAIVLGSLAVVVLLSDRDTALAGIEVQVPLTPTPRIALTEFTNLTGDPALKAFIEGLEAETHVRLSDFGLLVVPASAPSEAREPARYLLTANVRQEGQVVRVSPRLVEIATGLQVWTDAFDDVLAASKSVFVQEEIATRLAAILANPFGPIYEREIAKAEPSYEKLDTYGCVLQFRAYAKSLDPAARERSKRCSTRITDEGPQPAYVRAGLAIVYLHEYWYEHRRTEERLSLLQLAENAARRALESDDRNLLANIAIAEIQYAKGDSYSFRVAAERALALATNPSTSAQIGFLMTLSGDADSGQVLLEDALASEPRIPGWYYVAYSFALLMNAEYEQALDWALRVNSNHWFPAPLAAAAAAGLSGEHAVAENALERLRVADPAFEEHGRAMLQNWIQDPELVMRLVEGLNAAGLSLCVECKGQ